MADTDSGGLLVQIGVTQARMERELATVVKQAAKAAQQAEDAFTAANTNIAKSSTTAFNSIGKGSSSATTGVKNTSYAVANLTSQLNDIGTQLAGGQSPFQIMLQQGTQIGQLFTQTGGSFKSFGGILADAALSAISPFNLLTFAVIGLGGAAVQYFASLIDGGENSAKVLQEHQQLIEGAAKAWGNAVPALQDYLDRLETVKDVKDLKDAAKVINDETVKSAKSGIDDISDSFAELINLLQSVGENQGVMLNLQNAFRDFTTAAKAGNDTTKEAQAVQDALAAAIASSGIPALTDFANAFDLVTHAAAVTAGAVANVNSQVANAINQAAQFQAQLQNTIQAGTFVDGSGKTRQAFPPGKITTDDGRYIDIPEPEARPSFESFAPPKTSGGRHGGGRGAHAYDDEVQSINERTAALTASTQAQAAINPLVNDFGYASEKAATEQKLLADAQKQGLAITPQLRDQISALADKYASASAQGKQLADSQKQIQKQAEEWNATEKDVFGGFLKDLKDGKSGAEALSDALNKLSDRLLDMALDSIFNTKTGINAGGSAGSGLFGSIIGGIGKLFGFASGTANTGGKRGVPAGVVHGQEAVIPLPAGGKVPVQIAGPAAQQGKSSRDVVAINLTDDSGRMADIADQRIQTASGTIVQVSVNQSYKQVQKNMSGLMTDAQARGG